MTPPLTHGDDPASALVCASNPETQRLVAEQLTGLGYRVQTGLFVEDVALKLKTHTYDVVVVDEHFDETLLETNPALAEAISVPAVQRRRQFLALVGPNLTTDDEQEAFSHSVDAVCALADLPNLQPIIRRGVTRQHDFYAPLRQCIAALEKM